MSKAIVVGSINMDVVAFVDRHPELGETIFGREVNYFPGGKGSNQAVSCRRLGCETLLVGRVGDDAFGEQLLSFQQREGIDVGSVRRLTNASTGTAFVTVADSSANSIVVISGANASWDDEFVNDLPVESGDIVLAQFEIPDRAIALAFAKARMCGATTLLNPSPARPLSPSIADTTDLLVVNEHELATLSGHAVAADDEQTVSVAANNLLGNGYRAIVVTLGEHGVRLFDGVRSHRIEARTVEAVDSTAAGDTFIGGLTAGLLSGMALPEAAELANIAASISVTRRGAASSIPTRAEVDIVRRIDLR